MFSLRSRMGEFDFADYSRKINLICRCCLLEHSSVLDVFETGICEKLQICVNISVTKDSALPTKVCEQCFQKIVSYYDFLQTCKRSEATLWNWLTPFELKNFKKAEYAEEVSNSSIEIYLDSASRPEIESPVKDANLDASLSAQVSVCSTNNQVKYFEPEQKTTESLHGVLSKETPGVSEINGDDNSQSNASCSVTKRNTLATVENQKHPYVCPKEMCSKGRRKLQLWKKEKVCNICDKKFRLQSDFKSHLTSHHAGQKAKYQCSECGRTFVRSTNLLYHMKIHSGERPHQCPSCEKGFITRSQLNAHLRTHTKVKPPPKEKCLYCGKDCLTNSELRVHLRTHTGERPFQCNICCRKFLLKVHLDVHTRTHTGEKPYPCSVCGRCFSSLSTRKKHMFLHSGEKHFRCDICEKSFAQVGILNTHKKRHKREKSDNCLGEC